MINQVDLECHVNMYPSWVVHFHLYTIEIIKREKKKEGKSGSWNPNSNIKLENGKDEEP